MEVDLQLQRQWLVENTGGRCAGAECWVGNANMGLHPFFSDSSDT